MRKVRWMLPLVAVSILILLGISACGGVEGATNSTVKTPIERIQDLELDISSFQSSVNKGLTDYGVVQGHIDNIRSKLDALIANMPNITTLIERIENLETTCNVTGNTS